MPGGSLYDSHGDVLVTKVRCSARHLFFRRERLTGWTVLRSQVHKNNSLEHLSANRRERPSSASSMRSSQQSGSQRMRPGSAMPRMQSRPPSRDASVPSFMSATKSTIQKMIDGDNGPAMVGVSTYPYTRAQREYLSDFQALVASTIEHPYMATTAFNRSSVPHDLLYGSNFDDDRFAVQKKWKSECRRSYHVEDARARIVQSKRAAGSGVRSECVQFLG